MIRPVRKTGDPVLKKKAKAVANPQDPMIRQLVIDMFETLYQSRGVGLAAPQVGESKRLVVVDCGRDNGGPYALINPKIVHQEGTQVGIEACLSIPGWIGDVERAFKIVVKAQDLRAQWFKVEAEGLLSRCLQHEIDHLDGILFVDKAQNLRNMTLDELAEEQKEGEQTETQEALVG